VVDLVRNTSARLTFTRAVLGSGVWSPDGNQVAFAANNGGVLGIYRKATSGAGKEELVWKVESGLLGPTHWSADGRFLLVGVNGGKTGPDIWVVPMKGDRKPFVFLNGEFGELGGRFSPDGKWIAYISNESGRGEIYVQPFNPDAGAGAAAPAGKWLVSKGGSAGMPRWRSDGKEIYHMTLDGRIMAVDISTSPVFRAGEQKQLFQVPAAFVRSQAPGALADATADGKRFMFLAPEGALNTPEQFTVVTNWMAALKK
jgi:Tol biopolymer transport system component